MGHAVVWQRPQGVEPIAATCTCTRTCTSASACITSADVGALACIATGTEVGEQVTQRRPRHASVPEQLRHALLRREVIVTTAATTTSGEHRRPWP